MTVVTYCEPNITRYFYHGLCIQRVTEVCVRSTYRNIIGSARVPIILRLVNCSLARVAVHPFQCTTFSLGFVAAKGLRIDRSEAKFLVRNNFIFFRTPKWYKNGLRVSERNRRETVISFVSRCVIPPTIIIIDADQDRDYRNERFIDQRNCEICR